MGGIRVVSGGQTGVDRGALDAALELGVPCGGWCPRGRLAEDGPIPDRYPMVEMPTRSYLARTRRNVIDSDGTLVIAFGRPTGGTAQTIRFCVELERPHLVLDGDTLAVDDAASRARLFVLEQGIRVLNVAGPRASGEPRGQAYSKAVILRLLSP